MRQVHDLLRDPAPQHLVLHSWLRPDSDPLRRLARRVRIGGSDESAARLGTQSRAGVGVRISPGDRHGQRIRGSIAIGAAPRPRGTDQHEGREWANDHSARRRQGERVVGVRPM